MRGGSRRSAVLREQDAREVAGGAAVLVDPFSVDDIRRGIEDALSRRNELIIWGLRQAARREWSETARLTVSAYREVI